jgi:hypothetical protein
MQPESNDATNVAMELDAEVGLLDARILHQFLRGTAHDQVAHVEDEHRHAQTRRVCESLA